MNNTTNRPLRIIVACESSGTVREAFNKLGHDAVSCDLLPADDGSPYHYQGDMFDLIEGFGHIDLLIAHPPCTYLSSSGLHWNGRVAGRAEKTADALAFVRRVMALDIAHIAIENPTGCISTQIDAREYGFSTAKASQYVQPYEYGHDASKKTGLWLKGLPCLVADPAQRVAGRLVTLPSGKVVERWSNQTDSGQNALAPSADRWKERSKTYQGIADAMAEQWSRHLTQVRSAS